MRGRFLHPRQPRMAKAKSPNPSRAQLSSLRHPASLKNLRARTLPDRLRQPQNDAWKQDDQLQSEAEQQEERKCRYRNPIERPTG